MNLPRAAKPFWLQWLPPPYKEWLILCGDCALLQILHWSLSARLGFPASRPVEAPGSNQHRSIPLAPRGSCKNQSTVRKFATDENRKVQELHGCIKVCIMSAQNLLRSAKSVHQVCIFKNYWLFPGQPVVLMQTTCRTRADFADLKQTWCRLDAHFFSKVCVSQTMQTF